MASVNTGVCIGCGACVAVCPEGFELGSDGKSHAKPGRMDCAKAAADGCPVGAISL